MRLARWILPVTGLLLVIAGCSTDDSAPVAPVSTNPGSTSSAATSSTTTTVPIGSALPSTAAVTDESSPPTSASGTSAPITSPPGDQGGRIRRLSTREIVEYLASDELAGRDNGTEGSTKAREMLALQLSTFAEPLGASPGGVEPEIVASFLQPFDGGANVIGVIPGGELKDEYVLIGGHYDHIGAACTSDEDPADTICNGATDNATGAAAAIAVGRAIAETGTPRRSVIVALWDREEDGLLGAAHYVANPLVPLAATKAYVNFDIQGTSLLPSLRNTTVVVGAETGGEPLMEAVSRSTAASPLDELQLSLLFGQGRSDHAVLVGAGVPSVFFTDSNNGCYHRANDDVRLVSWDKLDAQIRAATVLASDLVATDSPPVLDADAPPTSYDDAVAMLAVVERGQPDRELIASEARTVFDTFRDDLRRIVDAGDEAFGDADVATLLGGSVAVVDALTKVDCAVVRP